MACSSNNPEPSLEGLESRAEAYFEAARDWKFLDMYRFYPAEFKDVCTPKEFADEVRTAFEEIQEAMKGMNADADGFVDYEVIDVRIEGTDGLHGLNMLYKGDVVFTLSEPEDLVEWSFVDGKWLYAAYDAENCGDW